MTSSLTPPPDTLDEEPYLSVEAVAERLGVPLGILTRRVEAGDVPSRRTEGPEGVRYSLRLSDLGIEPADEEEVEIEATAAPLPVAEVAGMATPRPIAAVTAEIVAEIEAEIRAEAEADAAVPPPPPSLSREPQPAPPAVPPSAPELTVLGGRLSAGPRADLATMTLDAREVVGGLLDRWERTLEQRIYAEQRQRFESELIARQNHVKQLQLELQASRAENAAAQAEKDRLLLEKERQLAEREREVAQLRTQAAKRRGWRLFR